MKLRVKFWLETESGEYLLGPGALQLLLAIEQSGNLKAGAKTIGLSYRAAWDRLKKAEQGLGFDLLERRSGGEGGGRSVLTTEAAQLIERYRRFLQGLEGELEARFAQVFDGK